MAMETSRHRVAPGERLGHFEIGKPIGEGGMGLVFQARDLRLERTVALKVLPQQLFENEMARTRFLREARLAASISHPNVATIHEIDEEEGSLFIAMELVPGANLKDVLLRGSIDLDDILSIGIQSCDALEAAHRQGVVHRDVKSSNIMLTPAGQVKVLDFGLAKPRDGTPAGPVPEQPSNGDAVLADWEALEGETPAWGPGGSTATGVAVGTPSYMSPEQAEGRPVDERTDVFSLGVVLYEAASGQLPFKGANTREILKAIRAEDPTPLHDLNPALPAAFTRMVSKCLAKERDERYQDVAALRRDLTAIREGALPGRPLRALERILGRPALALAAVLVTLIAVALGRGFDARDHGTKPPLVAVLPFVSLSGSANEYIADGMTEQLIARLSQIPSLRVISYRSVMPYEGTTTPLNEIAVALGGVEWFVSGSVLVEGDEVRVSVEMMDDTLTNRAARVYERPLGKVLALQSDLAGLIVGALRLQLTERERVRLQRAPLIDDEAYRLYTKGRESWNRRTEEDYRTAIDYFRRALQIDPTFALAHAGLADAELLTSPPSGTGRLETYRAVKDAASTALAIDPELGEARAALAFSEYFLGWNWEAAGDLFQRAIDETPSYATAHHWYGDYLTAMGRIDEAVTEMAIARDLDPGSSAILRDQAWPLFMAGRWEEAARSLEQTLRVDPAFVPARTLLARTYARLGRYPEATALLQEIVRTFDPLRYREMIAEVHAVGGHVKDAEDLLRVLEAEPKENRWPYGVAVVYAALDRNEKAVEWLWKAYEEGDRTLANLNVDSRFESLESEERFVELLRRLAFPRPRDGG
jgi:TolB-like protein/Tfp pilus assembly protein PilF/tRNA A-37 threonylcarbamoyl transferase component Bud32